MTPGTVHYCAPHKWRLLCVIYTYSYNYHLFFSSEDDDLGDVEDMDTERVEADARVEVDKTR